MNLAFFVFGGAGLTSALGEERFNRRLEQLLHHCALQTSMKKKKKTLGLLTVQSPPTVDTV